MMAQLHISIVLLLAVLLTAWPVHAQEAQPLLSFEPTEQPAPKQTASLPKPKKQSFIQTRFKPSYVKRTPSLFMDKQDYKNLLDVIDSYERRAFYGIEETEDSASTDFVDDLLDELTSDLLGEEEVEELPPIVFPTYRLTSIIYDSSKSWSARINSRMVNNGNNSGELKVIHITEDKARFRWLPADARLHDELIRLYAPKPENYESPEGNSNTPPPTPSELHRVSTKKGDAYFSNDGAIIFNLSMNQTFYPELFKVYEGNVSSITARSVTEDSTAAVGNRPKASTIDPLAPKSTPKKELLKTLGLE